MANDHSHVLPVLAETSYESALNGGFEDYSHPLSFSFRGAFRISTLLMCGHHSVCVGMLLYTMSPFLIIAIGCYAATIGLIALALLTNRKRDSEYSLYRH